MRVVYSLLLFSVAASTASRSSMRFPAARRRVVTGLETCAAALNNAISQRFTSASTARLKSAALPPTMVRPFLAIASRTAVLKAVRAVSRSVPAARAVSSWVE